MRRRIRELLQIGIRPQEPVLAGAKFGFDCLPFQNRRGDGNARYRYDANISLEEEQGGVRRSTGKWARTAHCAENCQSSQDHCSADRFALTEPERGPKKNGQTKKFGWIVWFNAGTDACEYE